MTTSVKTKAVNTASKVKLGLRLALGLGLGILGFVGLIFASIQATAPNKPEEIKADFSTPRDAGSSSSSGLTRQTLFRAQKQSSTISYDIVKEELVYSGEVMGRNGCASLDTQDAKLVDGKVIITVKLKYEGEICTQVIKGVPFKGGANIKLTSEQAQQLDKTVQIESVNAANMNLE
ncbi:MAG: hypothetical protein OHK0017_02440 [Patescibacteria group bacterium]